MLFFTAFDFTSITSHIYNWALFLLWLSLFILSGAISPLFSSSILGTYQSGELIFHCHLFLPFHTVHGVLKARILSGLSFPSPVDHVLSELSTMTRQSWVALHGMAHSFIELDKAVVYMIILVSFLWLKDYRVQWSVGFHLIGNEGEGIYRKVIFDLNLEISVEYWEVNMLGKVTQLNLTGLCRNRNTWAG